MENSLYILLISIIAVLSYSNEYKGIFLRNSQKEQILLSYENEKIREHELRGEFDECGNNTDFVIPDKLTIISYSEYDWSNSYELLSNTAVYSYNYNGNEEGLVENKIINSTTNDDDSVTFYIQQTVKYTSKDQNITTESCGFWWSNCPTNPITVNYNGTIYYKWCPYNVYEGVKIDNFYNFLDLPKPADHFDPIIPVDTRKSISMNDLNGKRFVYEGGEKYTTIIIENNLCSISESYGNIKLVVYKNVGLNQLENKIVTVDSKEFYQFEVYNNEISSYRCNYTIEYSKNCYYPFNLAMSDDNLILAKYSSNLAILSTNYQVTRDFKNLFPEYPFCFENMTPDDPTTGPNTTGSGDTTGSDDTITTGTGTDESVSTSMIDSGKFHAYFAVVILLYAALLI